MIIPTMPEIIPPTPNELASAKILSVYPIHTQLNTLMNGPQANIDVMVKFINDVRAWANQEYPIQADLDAIQL